MRQAPNILTIAGSDSGGGAGIQADLKTIQALGGYGLTAITALTAQNGLTVRDIFPASAEFIACQIETIEDGFPVQAAKTGMLFSAEIIRTVSAKLQDKPFPLVVDPVAVSQSGCPLLEEEAVKALKETLLPLSDLLTPNIPEAEMLTQMTIQNADDIQEAGARLLSMVGGAVLIKGGHLPNAILVTDYLFEPSTPPREMPKPFIDTKNTHGTGCTLSAAIATFLGFGLPLSVAVSKAQDFLNLALRKSYAPGKGAGPCNHACLNMESNS